MRKILYVSILISLLVLASGSMLCALEDARGIEQKVVKAIKIEEKAQTKADAWAQEKSNILAEMQDLKHREQWLDFQSKKYKGYVKEEEKIIRDLNRKKEKLEKIEMGLEPYLEEVFGQLSLFVENDLQFLKEERKKRLSFLRASLDDYRVGLSEKLRRVLEALQVEANYGRSIERTDGVINLKDERIEVNFLRVGRLAMFFVSTDHKKVGYLDRKTGDWKLLDRRYGKEILKAIEMAERKRAIELVDLPIGKWKSDESEQ